MAVHYADRCVTHPRVFHVFLSACPHSSLQLEPQLFPETSLLSLYLDVPISCRFVIYERAVRSLPGSYKLWRLYLLERVALCERTAGPPSGPEAAPLYSATNSAFERCLVHLSRMPEIWRMNLKFLQQQQLLTRVRRTFDAALRALAVTQHELLWPEMMDYVKVRKYSLWQLLCVCFADVLVAISV